LTFRVHDTLTKEKRVFAPREPGRVRMYNCGPTVYGRIHVGNLRTFLFADVLRRWLEYLGYEVEQVMNITDVGHLQQDAEEGEDKLEAQAKKEKLDPRAIAEQYTALFFADIERLGVRNAKLYPRASDHVPQMLAIIDDLLAKGFAYQAGEDVYFDVARFPRYGKLSGNTVAELEAGARVEVREEKRHPADFALWKSDPRHLQKWSTRFGEHGFPGWHIECSAMAIQHLGEELDIHTGGEDNVFPHHECEIAQSESHTGKPFARYWMHSKFLTVDGGKMAKSLGNVYTLADVEARGHSPRALRFALIRGHYRSPLDFTWKVMEDARAALEKLDDLAARLRRLANGEGAAADEAAGRDVLARARAKFEDGLNDDLNMPQALSALFELRAALLETPFGKASAAEALEFLRQADGVLGVIQLEEPELDARVETLLAERKAARARKDWKRSDEIRDELITLGVAIEDTPTGTVWRRRG
jgi:cysteinyl-tRNA synthetase